MDPPMATEPTRRGYYNSVSRACSAMCMPGSHRLSVAGLARSKDTGMQRSIHAIHMQTKLPTSKIPYCLGATLRANVRTEKTKSPGGWEGLSAHVK